MFERRVDCYRVEETDLVKFMYEVGRCGLTYRIRKEEKDPNKIYVGGYQPVYRVRVYAPWWGANKLEKLFRETLDMMSVDVELW